MQRIRTAQWVENITGPDSYTGTLRYWLRLEPPALAWLSDLGDHDLIDERGHLHTASTWADCRLYPTEEPWTRDDYLRHVLPKGLREAAETGNRWETTAVQLEDQEAVRYHRTYGESAYRVEMSVWLEPESGLLLRMERTEVDPTAGKVVQHHLYHEYAYDVEPSEEVFDLPPPDKPLVVEDREITQDLTASLPADEREAIERLIGLSNEGWKAGAFREFSRAWHFPRGPLFSPLPGRAAWQKAVSRQVGRWGFWEAEVVSVTKAGFFGVAIATSTFAIVMAPRILWVKAKLGVKSEVQDRGWEGEATYYMQRRRGGYRVIHWEYPSEELAARFG
jgi:hypothetical protein